MILAVDVGNTNTMLCVFDGDTLIGPWRIETRPRGTMDELALIVLGLLLEAGVPPASLRRMVLACVVPPLTERLVACASGPLDCEALVVQPEKLGIPIRYNPPSAVGADRVANGIAAADEYGLPAVIVDFGTTTTVDVMSTDGEYLGGAIAPGVETSVDALFAHAARLVPVSLAMPAGPIGTTTEHSIRSGVVFGFAGQVDGLVRRVLDEIGGEAHVIATGGQAGLIAPASTTIEHVDELLTLKGLRLISDRADGIRTGTLAPICKG
jgi:type III pantothenate kinase